jgi:hypothetical protein
MSLLVRFNMLWCLALSGPLPPLETPPPTPVGASEAQGTGEEIAEDMVESSGGGAVVAEKMDKSGQLHHALQVPDQSCITLIMLTSHRGPGFGSTTTF